MTCLYEKQTIKNYENLFLFTRRHRWAGVTNTRSMGGEVNGTHNVRAMAARGGQFSRKLILKNQKITAIWHAAAMSFTVHRINFTYRAIVEDRACRRSPHTKVPLIFVNDRTYLRGLMVSRLSCTLDDVYSLHNFTKLHIFRVYGWTFMFLKSIQYCTINCYSLTWIAWKSKVYFCRFIHINLYGVRIFSHLGTSRYCVRVKDDPRWTADRTDPNRTDKILININERFSSRLTNRHPCKTVTVPSNFLSNNVFSVTVRLTSVAYGRDNDIYQPKWNIKQ